jgi:DnaJ family protein A protein 2
MARQKDPYEILGIKKSASQKEIRQAYRKKVKKYHPDRGGEPWIFREIEEAFARLSEVIKTEAASGGEEKPFNENKQDVQVRYGWLRNQKFEYDPNIGRVAFEMTNPDYISNWAQVVSRIKQPENLGSEPAIEIILGRDEAKHGISISFDCSDYMSNPSWNRWSNFGADEIEAMLYGRKAGYEVCHHKSTLGLGPNLKGGKHFQEVLVANSPHNICFFLSFR